MEVVHLAASSFFGGPERQMLGLAESLRPDVATRFVLFREGGRGAEFRAEVELRGFAGRTLAHDTPHLRSTVRELTADLRARRPAALFCHGYKANLLGRIAARRVGVPAVAVSRGWTGENLKVRAYEWLDRRHLRRMDRVVAVSNGQAAKVRLCGVAAEKLTVIRNSARLAAFRHPDPDGRADLLGHFPMPAGVRRAVVAAGRLSPEKGFDVLIEAAAQFLPKLPGVGVVIFGEGAERAALERQCERLGLADRVLLPGHTRELDRLLPWAECLAIPSHTEGLPNVALEASAAGVPTVATRVGGNGEVIRDCVTGLLVPPADPARLAAALRGLLSDGGTRRAMGIAARRRVQAEFTFAGQAKAYRRLLAELSGAPNRLRGAA